MKKKLTRISTMLLAVMMLMGIAVTNASAATVMDYNYKTAPDYTEWHEEFRPTQDYKDFLANREKPASQLNALGFVDPGTMNTKVTTYTARYLNTLRQYMPHVTDAQRAGVAAYNYGYHDVHEYGITGWTNVTDAAQFVNTVNTFNAQTKPIRENTGISRAAQTAQIRPLAQAVTDQFDAYYKAGKVLTSTGKTVNIAQYDSNRMTDEQIAKFRSGTFVSFLCRDSENEYGVNNNGGGVYAWLSDSFQNDTIIRNIFLNNYVTYYGENVFRNSALETVVFPDVWLSDHSPCWVGPTVTARTQNGLIFGKEAVIIEANSFADCKNLKSVIVPCEPARLYLAPGVFKNCPNLTVYAPAGGTLESYCKANGIKFQAMAGAYLEPRVDEAGMMPLRVARTTADDWGDHWCYYSRIPVAGYAPDAATMNNYANGVGVVMSSRKDINAEQMTLLRRDLNRYRSDDIRNSAAVFLPSHTGVALNFGWNQVPYGSFKFPAGTRTTQIGW